MPFPRQDSAAPDDSGDERVKTAGAASLADFGTEDMKSGVESSVSQIGETKGLELQNLSQSKKYSLPFWAGQLWILE